MGWGGVLLTLGLVVPEGLVGTSAVLIGVVAVITGRTVIGRWVCGDGAFVLRCSKEWAVVVKGRGMVGAIGCHGWALLRLVLSQGGRAEVC